jgi:putative sterol carrier protein
MQRITKGTTIDLLAYFRGLTLVSAPWYQEQLGSAPLAAIPWTTTFSTQKESTMATMPKDASELFDVKLTDALKQHPDKAKEVNAIYCFNITGDGGGLWTVNLTSDPPSVEKGDAGSAQCKIEVAHDDFMEMLKDPQVGMQLYFQGKLKVEGDPMLATKLQQLFDFAA